MEFLIIFLLITPFVLGLVAFGVFVFHFSAQESHKRRLDLMRANAFVTTLAPDNNGNYPVRLFSDGAYIQPERGNIAQNVPHSFNYAPHVIYKGHETPPGRQELSTPFVDAQDVREVEPLSAGDALDLLPRNQLAMCFGVDGDGKPVTSTLPESVHLLNVGGSGMGKSTLAANLVTQLISLNDADRLQLAICDIKGTTAKHFAPYASLIATKEDEIVVTMQAVRKLVDYRRERGVVDGETWLLLVEEALALQYYLSKEQFDEYSSHFSAIALLGREFGVYLMACSQVDYSTPQLRNSRGNFASRMSAAVMPKAAEAMGFMNRDLVKEIWRAKKPGQFLLENVDGERRITAPRLDLKSGELARLLPKTTFQAKKVELKDAENLTTNFSVQFSDFEPKENFQTTSSQPQIQEIVKRLKAGGMTKGDIIASVYNVKAGGSKAYRDACNDFDAIVTRFDGAA